MEIPIATTKITTKNIVEDTLNESNCYTEKYSHNAKQVNKDRFKEKSRHIGNQKANDSHNTNM